jgi:hypothetical protein
MKISQGEHDIYSWTSSRLHPIGTGHQRIESYENEFNHHIPLAAQVCPLPSAAESDTRTNFSTQTKPLGT